MTGYSRQSSRPSSVSEQPLAIDAAVPVPEPANVPPPTASDFAAQAKSLANGSPIKIDANKSEASSAETKSASVNPVDAKPADASKAAEIKPAEANSAEVKPAEANPIGTKSADTTATITPVAPVAGDAAPKADQPVAATTVAPATAEQPAATPAVSKVAAADQPVADKLRDLLDAKNTKYFDRKAERTSVEAFYKDRDYAPLWTEAGQLTARAKGVIARLQLADRDGLNAADYPVPGFAAATTPDALADAELSLTASMLDYARQAQSGRVHWSRVSADILYPEHPINPTEVMTKVSAAADPSAALESYNPPLKLYRELRTKLAELRGQTDTPVIKIEDGAALKYVPAGKKRAEVLVEDPRVPQLRSRLGITENADDTHYDAKVAEAVRKFQASSDLRATGVLDERTVRALNSPKRDKQIDTVVLNMERWRWVPRDLGARAVGDAYSILNIPDYSLKVMHNGAQVWTTRVVTGKPGQHATPLLTETMKYITINPTWNVPPSIIQNEYLPALAQDPTVLDRMGLKFERNRDGTVHISQPPGERNALGRIRFNFPNKFLVYQHDTPDKYLFAKSERAFSHGCMRVQNPDQYAEALLGIALPQGGYSAAKIRSMYGNSEQNINLPTPIPVNITYQTAFVDNAGKLEFRRDVYGLDARLAAALRGTDKRVAEIPVQHAQPSYSTRPKMPQGQGQVTAVNDSPPSFFQMLFGGGQPQQPPQPIHQRRHVAPR
jgi:murein L,D-transpeptidase YcbB/YkuD